MDKPLLAVEIDCKPIKDDKGKLVAPSIRYPEVIDTSSLYKHLTQRNLQKLTFQGLETAQNFAYSMLDDTGIVVHLQMNLQNNLARFIARKQIPFLKRFHIGRVY
jgi:hypothetical protein